MFLCLEHRISSRFLVVHNSFEKMEPFSQLASANCILVKCDAKVTCVDLKKVCGLSAIISGYLLHSGRAEDYQWFVKQQQKFVDQFSSKTFHAMAGRFVYQPVFCA